MWQVLTFLDPKHDVEPREARVFFRNKKTSGRYNVEKFSHFLNDKKNLGRVVWCYFLESNPYHILVVHILHISPSKKLLAFHFLWQFIIHIQGPGGPFSWHLSASCLGPVHRKKLKRCISGSRSSYRSWDISGVAQDSHWHPSFGDWPAKWLVQCFGIGLVISVLKKNLKGLKVW